MSTSCPAPCDAGACPPLRCPFVALRRRARLIAILLLAVAAATAAPLHGREPEPAAAVRIYDLSGVSADARRAAIAEAAAIFREAGMDIEWRDCRDAAAVPGCSGRRARDLMVRLVSDAHELRVAPHHMLGYAVVEAMPHGAALATVFVNRVERTGRRAGTDVDALLGRAIAHEVGHLLLGTNRHSATGLMRELWTDQEMARDRPDDWVFTSPDRQQLTALSVRSARLAAN